MARLPALLVTVLALGLQPARCRTLRASKIFLDSRDVDKEYDYVIVGGGTAGLTVADRLTESGDNTVLVVEYGQLSPVPNPP